uniref:Uncharacterized protein n=1 Tax=viral metagenome TaxID=1070528 RepID=A0A6H2A148_9ZZZZ
MDTTLPRKHLEAARDSLNRGDWAFYVAASLVGFGWEVADLLDRIPEPQDNGGRRPSEGDGPIVGPAAEASPAAPSLREQVAGHMHTVFPGTQWPVQFDRILALISDEDARRDAEIARLKDELSVARFVAMDAAQKIKAQVALLKEGIK